MTFLRMSFMSVSNPTSSSGGGFAQRREILREKCTKSSSVGEEELRGIQEGRHQVGESRVALGPDDLETPRAFLGAGEPRERRQVDRLHTAPLVRGALQDPSE